MLELHEHSRLKKLDYVDSLIFKKGEARLTWSDVDT